MKMVEFEYDIGDEVLIKAINIIGKIDSLTLDNNGKMFRVIFWNDGSRHSIWMYSFEIGLFKPKGV